MYYMYGCHRLIAKESDWNKPKPKFIKKLILH